MLHVAEPPHLPLVLHFGEFMSRLSGAEFYDFCQINRDLRIERTSSGDLVVMAPTGGNTGRRNSALAVQLGNWADRDGAGIAFDSSTLFHLPNGAMRSPDASWVVRSRWDALSQEDRDRFPPLAPDFVVELRSRTDRLEDLQAKLAEYIENGVRLGWLIDPGTKQIEVYRPGQSPQLLNDPAKLSGEPEMPGFALELHRIW